MAEELSRIRCFNHKNREAAVKCLSCEHYFCRECIAEHDGRMVCSDCLNALTNETAKKKGSGLIFDLIRFSAVFIFIWSVIYFTGWIVSSIPDSFHEHTIWQTVMDSEDS